ncbi:hypothetical protein B7P43_G17379 [Cryptotermes secundus]|uniref:Endonuclease/exonuclease/phosphatase domain-containing protein n=1 Tax=Cryptotermes secundus TaxID=105785 RepID=A0A2J7RIU6_9NEOP|nr:hypothetical protein B7P43_G17379 [Cryptotermes secundus]
MTNTITEDPTLTGAASRRQEDASDGSVATGGPHKIEGKSLVLLQVNCRSILNNSLEFWNLIDAYNPDVIIGTESWLREEISNAEVFRDEYTTFRRDRNTRGGGVFICVKNYIACVELWVDEDFEMIAVEVKGRDPKCTWEIVGIYRAPNEDMRVIERLAVRADSLGNFTKRSITSIAGDLNLPYADWNGNVQCTSGGQESVNRLVWESGYTQVVNNSTRGDALLDVYLVRPENLFTSCSVIQGISDHCVVLLEVEWEETYYRSEVERLVPVYHKADTIGLQHFSGINLQYGQAMVDALRKYGIISRT